MTINIFVLKGDLNGKNRSGAFLFCRVYVFFDKEKRGYFGPPMKQKKKKNSLYTKFFLLVY